MRKPAFRLFFLTSFLFAGMLSCLGQGNPGTVRYPTNLDTADSLFQAANNAASTLNGSITSGDTTLTLASAANFPTSGAVTCQSEIIYYTGKSGNQLTGLLRGQEGTTAASHANGVTVRMNIIASYHNTLKTSLIAVQTKTGTGSSTPIADSVFQGTGTGTSAWQTLTGTPATTFLVGKNTAKLNNTLKLGFSSDANPPGIRWLGGSSSGTMQFSDDGTTWRDMFNSASIGGSGSTNAIAKFASTNTLASSNLSDSGSEITSSSNFRVTANRSAFGDSANLLNDFIISVKRSITSGSGPFYGININPNLQTSGNTSAGHIGLNALWDINGSANHTGSVAGGTFQISHGGSGTITGVQGVNATIVNANNGVMTTATGLNAVILNSGVSGVAITNARGVYSGGTVSAGTVTNWYGAFIDTPNVSGGAITNYWGLYINTPPSGKLYSLFLNGAGYARAGTTTFSSLSTSVDNGTFIYCSDCTIASPCAGSGSGALAKRINGAWVCN